MTHSARYNYHYHIVDHSPSLEGHGLEFPDLPESSSVLPTRLQLPPPASVHAGPFSPFPVHADGSGISPLTGHTGHTGLTGLSGHDTNNTHSLGHEAKPLMSGHKNRISSRHESILQATRRAMNRVTILGIFASLLLWTRVYCFILYALSFSYFSSDFYNFTAVSVVLALNWLFSGAAGYVQIVLTLRWRYDYLLCLCLFFETACLCFESTAWNLIVLCAFWVLGGASQCLTPMATSYIHAYLPFYHSGRCISAYYTWFMMGYVVAPLLAGVVMECFDARMVFIVSNGLSVCALTYALFFVFNKERALQSEQLQMLDDYNRYALLDGLQAKRGHDNLQRTDAEAQDYEQYEQYQAGGERNLDGIDTGGSGTDGTDGEVPTREIQHKQWRQQKQQKQHKQGIIHKNRILGSFNEVLSDCNQSVSSDTCSDSREKSFTPEAAGSSSKFKKKRDIYDGSERLGGLDGMDAPAGGLIFYTEGELLKHKWLISDHFRFPMCLKIQQSRAAMTAFASRNGVEIGPRVAYNHTDLGRVARGRNMIDNAPARAGVRREVDKSGLERFVVTHAVDSYNFGPADETQHVELVQRVDPQFYEWFMCVNACFQNSLVSGVEALFSSFFFVYMLRVYDKSVLAASGMASVMCLFACVGMKLVQWCNLRFNLSTPVSRRSSASRASRAFGSVTKRRRGRDERRSAMTGGGDGTNCSESASAVQAGQMRKKLNFYNVVVLLQIVASVGMMVLCVVIYPNWMQHDAYADGEFEFNSMESFGVGTIDVETIWLWNALLGLMLGVSMMSSQAMIEQTKWKPCAQRAMLDSANIGSEFFFNCVVKGCVVLMTGLLCVYYSFEWLWYMQGVLFFFVLVSTLVMSFVDTRSICCAPGQAAQFLNKDAVF